MAATLMEIKSKMLLPRPEEAASDEEDPRLGLVKQLIEYKQFKEAAALLEEADKTRVIGLRVNPSRPTHESLPFEATRAKVELWDLVSAFGRIMQETLAQQPQAIVDDPTPVHVYMDYIVDRLTPRVPHTFCRSFRPTQHAQPIGRPVPGVAGVDEKSPGASRAGGSVRRDLVVSRRCDGPLIPTPSISEERPRLRLGLPRLRFGWYPSR